MENIINNRIYCGEFVYHKGKKDEHIYENVVEGIISREMWFDCQNQKGKNSRNYTRTIYYLFLQKLYCPKCHTLMAGRSPDSNKKYDYVYYRCHKCHTYVNEKDIIKQQKEIIYELVEYDFLVHRIYAPVIFGADYKEQTITEIESLKRQRNRLKDAYKTSIITLEEFTEGIIDKEVAVSYENKTQVVSLSSPKTEKEIEDYIQKLQNYYRVEYFKIEVIKEEDGTFYLEYSPNKKQEIIKLIPIKDEKCFKSNLGYGVISVS